MAEQIKPYTHRTPKEWAEILNKYKTGEYSVTDLAEEYSISISAINKKLLETGTVKGELLEKGTKALENKYLQEFEKRGWDRGRISEKVINFLDAKKTDPFDRKKKVDDMYIQEKGLVHYEKLTGADKPQDDKNAGVSPPTVKIMIVTKDGAEVLSNLGIEGINI